MGEECCHNFINQDLTFLPGLDPGFSVGGCGPILGGFWPPTWALFSENVCENERIGSCRGGMCWHAPPRSAYAYNHQQSMRQQHWKIVYPQNQFN